MLLRYALIVIKQETTPPHPRFVIPVTSWITQLLQTQIILLQVFQQFALPATRWHQVGNQHPLIIQVFLLHKDMQYQPVLIVIKETILPHLQIVIPVISWITLLPQTRIILQPVFRRHVQPATH
jgi:hypothetical protein